MDWERIRDRGPGRFFGVVIGVTLVMTASLVGIVALVTGETTGIGVRLPYYVLVTAIAFVTGLWKLDDDSVDGVTVLIATTGLAIATGGLVSLAVEGIRFGITDPDDIAAPDLLAYFLAAGLLCTGLGMWGLRHWREFTTYEHVAADEESG
ncbi:hypothetical protein ACFQGT_09515 [Natrialbaceae archaeon GCM10025810]|uniref:hypothetical protein n=1 Tax=Halovalidus salilacus TaxID=3075124 RepID=UPI00361FC1C7